MNDPVLTHAERVDALLPFGYTPREAAFITLAALHGGYFLRRQYAQFVSGQDGGTVSQLIEKTLRLNHARASTYRHKMQLYHLCARPLYEALGQADNRNRRRRAPLSVKNKLMGLDFVLAHRESRFLATEREKLAYFAGDLQIPESCLPAKLYYGGKSDGRTARYFIDKYPIFLSQNPSTGDPPVVSFCFIDEGAATLSHFDTYLAQYARLFASLPEFRLVYVAASPTPFQAAERAFERLTARWQGPNAASLDPDIRRRLEHFEARQQYETKRFHAFDRARLIRFRNEQLEFAGPQQEFLYERWKQSGETAVIEILAPERRVSLRMNGTFSTSLLQSDYDLFGNFAAF
jgi:hypothetical protein